LATDRFFDALAPIGPGGILRPIQFTVEKGVIQAVSRRSEPLAAQRQFDCGGQVVLPGFIDTHLHLPGSMLYQRHGVDLMSCSSISDYCQALERHSGDQAPLRGFGWSQTVFQSAPSALPDFQAFLNRTFPTLPVALFSDDYHSCIIDRALAETVGPSLPEGFWDRDTGLLRERAVFALLESVPALSFQPDKIADTLLAFQALLLSRGITAVQTLMPIGMTEDACFRALRSLEAQGHWKLGVNLAVTAHPRDDPEVILRRFRALEPCQSDRIRLRTVKIYIDGVVDNQSAYLSAPYERSGGRGAPIWTDGALERFCARFHQAGIQIHAHVIGDAAADQIARVLERVIGPDTSNQNRHVLAHIQLAGPETRERIGRLRLFCAMQPFWFPQDEFYPVDLDLLGRDRAGGEYPCRDLLRQGAVVTFGSDSPVTPIPDPLTGIACAMGRGAREERLSLQEALDAYTASAARQLFREREIGRIAPGSRADFVLLKAPADLRTPQGAASAAVTRTFVDGECVYRADRQTFDDAQSSGGACQDPIRPDG